MSMGIAGPRIESVLWFLMRTLPGAVNVAFAHRKMYVVTRPMAASPTLLSTVVEGTDPVLDEDGDDAECPAGRM